VNAAFGVNIKEYRKGWQNNSLTFPTRKDSMVNHFQLSSQEFNLATSQAKKNSVRANFLVKLLLSSVYV
jgi:hypothetical protein